MPGRATGRAASWVRLQDDRGRALGRRRQHRAAEDCGQQGTAEGDEGRSHQRARRRPTTPPGQAEHLNRSGLQIGAQPQMGDIHDGWGCDGGSAGGIPPNVAICQASARVHRGHHHLACHRGASGPCAHLPARVSTAPRPSVWPQRASSSSSRSEPLAPQPRRAPSILVPRRSGQASAQQVHDCGRGNCTGRRNQVRR